MKYKKLLIVFIAFLFIGVVLQFLSYDYILNYLKKDFSPDGNILDTTYTNYKNKFEFIKILFIVLPLLCLVFIIFQNKIMSVISYISSIVPKVTKIIYSHISISHLFWFSIVMILILSIYAVFNFDIGLDEAWYLNDIQNINKYGSVYRDFGNDKSHYYDIQNLPLNLISNFTVPLLGFSVTHIRIIVLLFALLLIPVLFKLFDELTAKLSIIFLFLYPGIISLTSAVFLEFTALLFIILALILLKNFEVKNKNYLLVLSALFMSISMATKIQFSVLIGIILIILFFVDFKKSSIILKYSLFIMLFIFLILIYSFIHYGYHNGVLLFKYLFLGGNQGELTNINLNLIINKFLILNNLIFIPILLFIWSKTWKIIKKDYDYLYMKIIFIGAIAILIYWNIFFGVLTWRNAFVGIAFNLILVAIYLKENYKSAKLMLIPYIVVGTIANLIFVQHGAHNDVQYYNVHLLDELLTVKRDDAQQSFFSKAAEIIKPEDDVFVPGHVYTSRIYLNNRSIKRFINYEQSNGSQFIIIIPADIKEGWMDQNNVQDYILRSKIIFQAGSYTLYQLQ